MKHNNSRGFSLPELLIVVMVISLLTAASVRSFSREVENSRRAVDTSNMRAAKAMAMADAILNAEVYGCSALHYAFDWDEQGNMTITDLDTNPFRGADKLAAPVWRPGTLRGMSRAYRDCSLDITVRDCRIISARWVPVDPDTPVPQYTAP